ncbi:MAG: neutral/alkaline non-lysosomal ceramidase N-terminal domain-containing protein [Planctomycetes bacterium]|nr:neutral/alkaline non-lysosomal ceramidase N-terminal domain-containing protein [Planctomycetota bacterium]
MSLKAGTGRSDISPRQSMFLVGYPHVQRMSAGVHDPLYASALYLDDGTNAVISIALDTLYVSHHTARECRAEIGRATGLPTENIMISATHTHSAPVTADILAWHADPVVPPLDDDYMRLLHNDIVRAATSAHESAGPAVVAITSARAEGVGGNRLSPDGVHDREVGIIYVKSKRDGKPLALQVIYSMHPTVIHEDTTLATADFPGAVRCRLEDELAGCRVLYHTGPCGNLSPRYHVSAQTFAEAERLGAKLAGFVGEAIDDLDDADFSDDPNVAAAAAFVELPGREFPSVAEARANLDRVVARYNRLKRENAGQGPIRTAECEIFGAEEQVELAKAQESGELLRFRREHMPAEVQVLRIGDAFIAALPGECFVEYSLQIKQHAPGRAFVVSMANGELQGYITTPGARGYEADMSMFKPESGPIMVAAALRLMSEFKA